MFQRLFLTIVVFFAILKISFSSVYIINLPSGAIVPDVVMDSHGILHIVYCKNSNAYYIHSNDNGVTFTQPVQVNSSGTVEYNMGERGPRLSVGNDGVIHVAWMDHWSSVVNVYARYTRSTDGGLSFEQLRSVSANSGVDGVAVATDGNNHVVVFWHCMVPSQSTIPDATWLHLSRSVDNGVTFGNDTNLVISNLSSLACSMCMTRAIVHNGKICLAFRSADNNIRDFYLIKGNASSNNYSAIRVNNDNWNINYCPMVGPEVTVSPDNRLIYSFMSNYHSYWAISDTGATGFFHHVSTPTIANDEIYPWSLADTLGNILMLWQNGLVSTSGTSVLKWAIYDTSGTFSGSQGTAGTIFSGTKGAAFLGTDNNFYIVANPQGSSSIEDINSNNAISLYPNPSDGDLFIDLSNTGSSEISVRIFDSEGKPLKSISKSIDPVKDNVHFDFRAFITGNYILYIESGKKKYSCVFSIK